MPRRREAPLPRTACLPPPSPPLIAALTRPRPNRPLNLNPLPRQLEACLFLGVDVEELYPKPLGYFIERAHGHSAHLARVIAEHHQTQRAALVGEVKAERKRLTAEMAAKAASAGLSAGAGSSLEDIERLKVAERARAQIEAEKKRMESVKAKQDKELQQNLAFELKLAEEAAKAQNKILQEQAEEAARKKAIEAARKKAIEAKKKEADEKREEEEERAAEQRRLANKEYEEEAKREAAARVEYKRLIAERKKEEDARREEAAAAERARAAEQEAKQRALAEKLADLKAQEEERRAKVLAAEAEAKAEAAARTAAQAARLEAARQRDAEALARKRTEYDMKLEEAAKRNAEKAEREAKELEAKEKAKAAKEKRMKEGLDRTRANEMEFIEKLQDNLKKRDQHVEELRREQELAHEERLLREALHAAAKEETIRRQRRREEYIRIRGLSAMQQDEEKLEAQRQAKLKAQMERQANQKRLLTVKHDMEMELMKMKQMGDISALQKLAASKGAGPAPGVEEGKQ